MGGLAGLAFGALYGVKWFGSGIRSFALVQLFIAIYSFTIPILLMLVNKSWMHPVFLHAIILLLTFLIAAFIGILFSTGSVILRTKLANRASDLYSYDLYGSALGSLLVSVLLIPTIGFSGTALVAGGLNLAALSLVWINRKSYL